MNKVLLFFIVLRAGLLCAEPERFYHALALREESGAFIPCFASRSFSEDLPEGASVLIAIHGAGFEAGYTFNGLSRRMRELGLEDQTLLITPQFFSTENRGEIPWVPNLVVWRNSWWRYGSIRTGFMRENGTFYQPEISSFSVVDNLIEDLLHRHGTRIRNMILFGFSAGGQFVQRYALYGSKHDPNKGGVRFTYIVSSPSSFMFLTEDRPQSGIQAPQAPAPKNRLFFDVFPYGMKDIDGTNANGTVCAYFLNSKQTKKTIRSRYAARRVCYYVGSKDETGALFDVTPEAMAQGETRLARTRNFMAHLQKLFPEQLNHTLTVVENAGHDLITILQSKEWGDLVSGLVLAEDMPPP